MPTKLNPYLNFRDNTRAAMAFYHSVFGGKLTISTFKDYNASESPEEDDLVMHSELVGDNGINFMASDTPKRMEFTPGTNFGMALFGDDKAELTALFEKLAKGGMVTMPLTQAMWGDTFGMLTDQFGVSWMVNISAPGQ
jgi:PhnB protein